MLRFIFFILLFDFIFCSCGNNLPPPEEIEERSRVSYDTWFYDSTFTYNGQEIHIDNQIKSLKLHSSPNISGEFNSSGIFYVGHGYVDSKDYYYFYLEENGMYSLKKLPVDEVKILETNDLPPCLGAYYDFNYLPSNGYKFINDKYSFTKINLIIVPIGTIIEEYTVN